MLNHYPSRIVVGAETRLKSVGACRDCGQPPGAVHSPGCASEECPGCGALLIGCACTCLSPGEGERIIKVLRDSFACPEDALQVAMGPERGAERSSYLVHAAMHALYDQLPPTARAELQRHFSLRYPTLVPLLRDGHGNGYYTAEQLAVALDIPLAEVQQRIEAMVDAGQGIRFADGIVVEKVN